MKGPAVVVYIHGISRHEPGYSDAWFHALHRHLSGKVEHQEVLWSDLVHAAREAMGDVGEALEPSSAEVAFAAEIDAELRRRELANGQPPVADGRFRGAADVASGVGFAPLDFIRYMYREHVRGAVLSRLHDVVDPLLRSGRRIHVIAHSWGTVIGYEGLRELDDQHMAGSVANLIVLGSAMSIPPVQRNLMSRIRGGGMPRHVQRWINVDAAGDIVGGTLRPLFGLTEEFLERTPTGCPTKRKGWFRRSAASPYCAHSSYVNPSNVAVNRDIVARFINQGL